MLETSVHVAGEGDAEGVAESQIKQKDYPASSDG